MSSSSSKESTFIKVLKVIKKRIKLRTILLLAITLSCNSFAWFVYATKVSSGVTAHVRTWNILFSANDNMIEEYVEFSIPSIYPGMEDYADSITAYNTGEHYARVSYEVVSAEILGVRYIVDDNTLTSQMLENTLASDFPFSITMGVSNTDIAPEMGVSIFNISVKWPYESGNDEADTYWGMKSYDFSDKNPDKAGIKLNIKISAVQPEE